MKRLLLILLLILISTSTAFAGAVASGAVLSGAGTAATAPPALLFSESFNGASDCDGAGALTDTNCDNTGWTQVTAGADYSGTGILGNTYSLTYTNTNGQSYHAFSGHTGQKIYAAEAFEATTGNSESFRLIGLYDTDGNILAYVMALWSTDHYNLRLYYYNNTGSLVNSTYTTTIVDDEVWYIKLEYTPGTGTNGVWDMYLVKDNAGFPGWGSSVFNYSTSSSTANAARIYPARSASATQVITITGVKVDDSDITY
jgi:hypothetical protein